MKKKRIKVSIVIPVYNTENNIRKCLDSITNQTYDNIEIILVNDGSTDGTLKVLQQYAKKDSRIKVVNQKNSGGVIARRNGIQESIGDYVLLEDSDDWLEDNLVEKCIEAISDHNDVDIVKFGHVFEPSKIKKNLLNDNKISKEVLEGKEINQAIDRLIYNSDCNHVWNEMVRRDLFDFNDKIFKRVVHKGEDLQINLHLYQRANKVIFLKDNLYHYLDNPSGITNNIRPERVVRDIKDQIYLNHIKESIAEERFGDVDTVSLQNNILSMLSIKIVRILENSKDPKSDLLIIQHGLGNTLPKYLDGFKTNMLNQGVLRKVVCKKIIKGKYLDILKLRPICKVLKYVGAIK